MTQIAILGKSDILEKVGWCKRAAKSTDEDERIENAKIEIPVNFDFMRNFTDASVDTYQIAPKFAGIPVKLPDASNFEIYSQVMFKKISMFVIFSEQELIPGRPDYEYGIGYLIETNNIFFDEKVYKTVDVQQVVKKMGGLMKETVTTKEKKVMDIADVYGDKYKGELYRFSLTTREKDNRDRVRNGARIVSNLNMAGAGKYYPVKLDHKWTDENAFFTTILAAAKGLADIIDQTFMKVGYESAPDFTLLAGITDVERNMGDFTHEEIGGGIVIETNYE